MKRSKNSRNKILDLNDRDQSLTHSTEKQLLKSLVKGGVLSKEDRRRVQTLRDDHAEWVGRILLNYGFCSRLELYGHWATVLELEFVDLIAEPPELSLVQNLDPSRMLDKHKLWIPWKSGGAKDPYTLIVAISNPDSKLPEGVAEGLGFNHVTYVLTTDWDILEAVFSVSGRMIAHQAAETLAQDQPHLSASRGPSRTQKLLLLAVATAMVTIMIWNRFVGLDILLTVLNVYFDASIITKLVFVLVGSRQVRLEEERQLQLIIEGGGVSKHRLAERELPTYTILIPCYREANVIPEVLKNIERLDYPRSKLQVLLLLEEDDVESLEAAKATRTSGHIRIVVIPDGQPRTKARACNVGLRLATGEFLVIFDAEDRPEPSQLRDAIDKFHELGPDFVCVQARLNYFNAQQNFLTRMFTLEYSLWFDYLLLGVEKLGLPFPLGGTSNHFRTQGLHDIGGWDPYNVTEDADIGIRAMALGFKVGVVESTTWEEACPKVRPWIRQRTRWIKGYMVTASVHSRSLRNLKKTAGWRGVLSIFLFIGGTPATFLINPLVIGWGLYGVFGLPLPHFELIGSVTVLNTFSLIFGNTTMVALSLMSTRRRKQWSLIGYALLNPVYWLLHSIAAWRALWQLIRTPSEWEKTPHGLSDFDSGHGMRSEASASLILDTHEDGPSV